MAEAEGESLSEAIKWGLRRGFETGELDEDSTCAKYTLVADDSNAYQNKFYSLLSKHNNAIIKT